MIATTRTGALTSCAPSAATTSAGEATMAATARARLGPTRPISGAATRGTKSATTALGTIARPTCQASHPWDRRTAGIAISIANHEAGTADADTALRMTVELRTTSTGRKPSG